MKNKLVYSVFGFISLGILLSSAIIIFVGSINAMVIYENIKKAYAVVGMILNILLVITIISFCIISLLLFIRKKEFGPFIMYSVFGLFIYDFLLRLTFGSIGLQSHDFWSDKMFLINYIFMVIVLFSSAVGLMLIMFKMIIGKIIFAVASIAWLVFFAIFFESTWNVVFDNNILMLGFAIIGCVTISMIPTIFFTPKKEQKN